MTNEPMWKCAEFAKISKAVENYTVMGADKLFALWHLVSQAAPGGDLIEVGVWRGGSGMVIADQARRHHPRANVHLCDTFTGIVGADPVLDSGYQNGEFRDTSAALVHDLAGLVGLKVITHDGTFPTSFYAYDEQDVTEFSFAHIDCDVYKSARESWEFIWPRVVLGGIVVFDDYGEQRSFGLTQFVNELLDAEKRDYVSALSFGQQAVFIKKGA